MTITTVTVITAITVEIIQLANRHIEITLFLKQKNTTKGNTTEKKENNTSRDIGYTRKSVASQQIT